ncbi:tryptophan synthase subunit alpha [Candidatus Izemoplasma sp. B36]|uniref:tryptophan synthase subunit alpha n=1 Tax=Candidatus Izemoplasma sp. B36 TaxID=3242468 RepID=UPI003558F6D9
MKLICYLSLGSPSLEQSKINAQNYIDAGCDVVEVDFPAKDPYLDSPYIQSRMAEALASCDDYSEYMKTIEAIKAKNPNANFIVLTYENTIREIGISDFIDFCKRNHLKDIICVGNTHPEVRKELISNDLLISTYVQYHLIPEEVEVAQNTNGFIYLQAKSGGKYHDEYKDLKSIIRHLREDVKISNPIYCGVGISTPDDVAMVKAAGADGAFVGSTVLKLQEKPTELKEKIVALKART